MTTRAEQLRQTHRKVLLWSLALAAVIHVAVFVLWPAFRTHPLAGSSKASDASDGSEGSGGVPTLVHVVFGPPTITAPDGTVSTEPPDRTLEVAPLVRLTHRCEALLEQDRPALRGGIRLRVLASGRVDVLGIVRTTGDACGDKVLRAVASDLLYHWLPDERYPAPVDLVQPISLLKVGG